MASYLSHSSIVSIVVFASGITLFLIGVTIMSNSFKAAASTNLKRNLERITKHKLLGLIMGIILTGLLQSSSATTLMVISLVHSNLISIYSAIPIIMGANIGTTITAQIATFEITATTPFLLIIGLLLIWKENKKINLLGRVIFSLGLIFSGLAVINYAIAPLREFKLIIALISYIRVNKIAAVLAGIILTAIIQSSSTGVVILQGMVSKNILSVTTALPVLLGQNIGTCLDTLIGSLATNHLGKQAAIIHLIFNFLGVVIFFFVTDHLSNLVSNLAPLNTARQIAHAHTIFNVVTALILLPFSSYLVGISKKIIKDK